jgi:hypothetical protein
MRYELLQQNEQSEQGRKEKRKRAQPSELRDEAVGDDDPDPDDLVY